MPILNTFPNSFSISLCFFFSGIVMQIIFSFMSETSHRVLRGTKINKEEKKKKNFRELLKSYCLKTFFLLAGMFFFSLLQHFKVFEGNDIKHFKYLHRPNFIYLSWNCSKSSSWHFYNAFFCYSF